jgi:glutamate formiminotransferase
VGARPPLIALNVWLPEATAVDARVIAARVREAGGGLPGVRALGFYLPEAGMAQVSMNLEDYTVTSPAQAVEAVRREAARLGVEGGDSELVGLIPGAALRGSSPGALRLRGFRPGQVLEAKMPALRRTS